MASLVTLRGLVYTYLGTVATDPAYPAPALTGLLNAAANKYINDIQQANPSWLAKLVTLAAASPTSRSYALPSDFAGWLDVRIATFDGSIITEVRDDELNLGFDGPVFSIIGSDAAATLTTAGSVQAGVALYFKYRSQPAELVSDADAPSWMPAQFHDLIARKAAIDAFGLGDESSPSMLFVQELADREAQFWFHLTRRGVTPLMLRQDGRT